jgi:multiple antibiotic resistance protein
MIGELVGFAILSFTSIFVIVDPITLVPIFLALTQGDPEAKRRAVVKKACLVSLAILVVFAVGGNLIFSTLGVTLPAFQIAGGILLLITGLNQLKVESEQKRTSPGELEEGSHKGDVAIVPMAMPLLAGPGAIATVMMLNSRATSSWAILPIVFGIVATTVITYWILRGATYVDRVLGKTGRAVLERVMGLLLVAIAVQFIVTGIAESFPGLIGLAHGAPEPGP